MKIGKAQIQPKIISDKQVKVVAVKNQEQVSLARQIFEFVQPRYSNS